MGICVCLHIQCLRLRLPVAIGREVVRTTAETDCFHVICDTVFIAFCWVGLSRNEVKPHWKSDFIYECSNYTQHQKAFLVNQKNCVLFLNFHLLFLWFGFVLF